ncbi:Ankyrin repeat-containing protein [Vanrija pseudolonga]|uniref:Ankyrin repeat-containing protein n=1 Tax=Vanrija pseudolonga TaxID=143232 RepID=A0AAF1BP71_9TREE|nr:Ankyrin repeat-containing protein [Vanrija pseudolonga]
MTTAPSRSAPPPPPQDDHADGASANEQLLAAAKTDNEELLLSALEQLEDVNYADGLGNTALHYAVIHGSTDVLEHLLEHDSIHLDLRNRLQGDTPLHIAVRQRYEEHPAARLYIGREVGMDEQLTSTVGSLLEAGADQLVKNRHGQRPGDALPPWSENADPESDDEKIRSMLRRALAETMVASSGDVVDEDDDIIDPNDIASDSD